MACRPWDVRRSPFIPRLDAVSAWSVRPNPSVNGPAQQRQSCTDDQPLLGCVQSLPFLRIPCVKLIGRRRRRQECPLQCSQMVFGRRVDTVGQILRRKKVGACRRRPFGRLPLDENPHEGDEDENHAGNGAGKEHGTSRAGVLRQGVAEHLGRRRGRRQSHRQHDIDPRGQSPGVLNLGVPGADGPCEMRLLCRPSERGPPTASRSGPRPAPRSPCAPRPASGARPRCRAARPRGRSARRCPPRGCRARAGSRAWATGPSPRRA
jgi:hypothetical protein